MLRGGCASVAITKLRRLGEAALSAEKSASPRCRRRPHPRERQRETGGPGGPGVEGPGSARGGGDRQRPAGAAGAEGRSAVTASPAGPPHPRAAAGILTQPVLFAAWCPGKGRGRADTRSRRGRRGSPRHLWLSGRLASPQSLPRSFAGARIPCHPKEEFWVAWAPSSWLVGTVRPREAVWWAQTRRAQRR